MDLWLFPKSVCISLKIQHSISEMRLVKNIYKVTRINLIDGDNCDLGQFFDLNHVKIPLAERGHGNHPK